MQLVVVQRSFVEESVKAVEQWGVINYPVGKLGLCMGMTTAKFVGTTEVYPDSPKVDAENCTNAQVATVVGALDYLTGTEAATLS